MTPRTTDNSIYWRALQMHLRRRKRDNYGITPMVPANIMLKLAERIWRKRARG